MATLSVSTAWEMYNFCLALKSGAGKNQEIKVEATDDGLFHLPCFRGRSGGLFPQIPVSVQIWHTFDLGSGLLREREDPRDFIEGFSDSLRKSVLPKYLNPLLE